MLNAGSHLAWAANPGEVVLNEVAWMGTAAGASDEWIELYNTTDQDLDLSGWTLEAADATPSMSFPTSKGCSNLTIPAHGFFLLERTDDGTVSDLTADCLYTGGLANSGESLLLKDPAGTVIDTANGDGGPWPAGTGGTGSPPYASAERVDSLAPDTDANWATNDGVHRNGLDAKGAPLNGTPQAPNSTLNGPPTAEAGVAQQVAAGDQVSLDGTLSSDPDGDPLTYQWSFQARPCNSSAALSDSQAARPHFVADQEGTYKLQLLVSDGALASAPAEVEVNAGGLLAFWTFDQGGTQALDCSGAGHAGTVQGPTAIPGASNAALDFDGVDDSVVLDDAGWLDGLAQGTVEFWLKLAGPQALHPSSGHTEGEVLQLFKDPTHFLRVYVSNQPPGGRHIAVDFLSDSGPLRPSPDEDIPLNAWTHVALTWGQTGARLYYNGLLKASVAQAGGTSLGHTGARLGVGFGAFAADFLRGQLDHVRVYRRALSGSELLDHYRALGLLGEPILCASAEGLSFTTQEGENPPPQTLEVFNCGPGTLVWSLAEEAPWLSATPRQGRNDHAVTVSVHGVRLPAGSYTALLTLTGQGARESPQGVPVALSVTPGSPRAPRALRARVRSPRRVDLLWRDGSFNEEGFRVYRDQQLLATLAADSRRYSDSGLSANTRYCYQVVAFNAAGETHSNERCATTRGGTTPLPPQAGAAALSWQTWGVGPAGGPGRSTSLALDAAGQPHIAYYDAAQGNLQYARLGPAGWQLETVDGAGDVGEFPSLALGPQGQPQISYYDFTRGALKYAWQGPTGWTTTTVDDQGEVGEYTSLALDAAGRPHIGYFDAGDEDLKYAWQDEAGWHVETVDGAGRVGAFAALALDALGRPHLSYYDLERGALKYAWQGPTGWTTATVDDQGDVGWDTAIALDGQGRAHLGYHDATHNTLKYARQDGTGWQVETLGAGVGVGEYVSLALDSLDRPHLGYLDAHRYRLQYATRQGQTWAFSAVDPQEGGEGAALALDGLGGVHLSYLTADGRLKYARGLPPAALAVLSSGQVQAGGAFHGAGFHSGSGADLAESLPSREPLAPGDVVELDPDHPTLLRKSRGGRLVVGVISAQPGLALGRSKALNPAFSALRLARSVGGGRAHQPPALSVQRAGGAPAGSLEVGLSVAQLLTLGQRPWLALAGRVWVRANAAAGPIRPGDLLTASPQHPGQAVRCRLPCRSPLIGKALTPLAAGQGLIEMLVMRP